MFRYRRTWLGSIKIPAHVLQRPIAIGLVALLVLPFGGSLPVLAQQQPQQQQQQQPPQSTPSEPVGGMPPPPAPSQSPETTNPNPAAGGTPGPAASQPPSVQSTPQSQQQNAPLGTAVAPYEKGIGVAASRPAGAVIAPAKQRRTRSFMIKMGVLIGAAVAVGTVVGLSSTSPSRPH